MNVFASDRHRDQVFDLLYRSIDCGAFDGGCLAFAQALQRLYGGEIFVIEGRRPNRLHEPKEPALTAQHAVLRLPDGRFADAGGIACEHDIVDRFIVNECPLGLQAARVRRFAAGDLPDAPVNEALVERLATTLRDPMTQKRGYRP